MVSPQVEQWRWNVASRWPANEVDNALSVMACESGGNPNANALTDREDSRGLMQINVLAHPQWAGLNLFDSDTNLDVAYQLWQAQGWGPWSCKPGIPQGAMAPIAVGLAFAFAMWFLLG